MGRVHCLQSQSLDNETDDMCQLLRFRYPTNDCSNYFRCLLVSDYRKISRETFPDYGTAQRHNTNIVMTMEQEQIETVFTNALSNQVQMHVQTFTLVGHVAKVYIFGSPFTAHYDTK